MKYLASVLSAIFALLTAALCGFVACNDSFSAAFVASARVRAYAFRRNMQNKSLTKIQPFRVVLL